MKVAKDKIWSAYYANKEQHIVLEEIYLNLGPAKRGPRINLPKMA